MSLAWSSSLAAPARAVLWFHVGQQAGQNSSRKITPEQSQVTETPVFTLPRFVPVQEWHWNQLLQHGVATPVPSAPTHQTLWVSNKVMRPPLSWARCNMNLWCRKMHPQISLLASWGQILSSRWGCLNISGRKTNIELLRYKSEKLCKLTEGKLDTAHRIQCFCLQWWRQTSNCSSTRGQMRQESFQNYFFFNFSGFLAEVSHSSPTVSSFVKLLQTP